MSERFAKFDDMQQSYVLNSAGDLVEDRSVKDGNGCSGLGKRIKIGLRGRRRLNCALFERKGEVWFLWGREQRRVDENLRFRRSFVFPFVRRFELINRATGERVINCLYWYRAFNDEFPDDGDLLGYVAEHTRDRTALIRFSCVWSLARRGESPDWEDRAKAIEACVRQRLSKERGP